MAKIVYESLYDLHFSGEPVLSPQGNEFLYVHTVMDKKANGYRSIIRRFDLMANKDVPLTYGGSSEGKAVQDKNPAYSPNGTSIAFLSNRTGKPQVYLLSASGGEARQLTEFPEGVRSFTFSPDGKQMVITTRSQTAHTAGVENSSTPNAAANSDSRAHVAPKASADGSSHAVAHGDAQADSEADLAADVKVITHLRYHGNGEGFYEGKPLHLWLLTISTGEIRQLTFGPYSETEPCFAPDGKSIAFISWRSHFEQEVTPSIYQLKIPHGEITQVYEGKGMASAPAYSPDGRYIAFFGHEKGERSGVNSGLWLVSLTEGGVRCLSADLDRPQGTHIGTDTRYETGKEVPVWTDGSNSLYFTATSEGNTDVYSASINGEVRCLTAGEKHVVTSFTVQDGTPLVTAEETPTCPAEIFLYRNGRREQVTNHNGEFRGQHDIAIADPFNIISQDGLTIPGWILRPTDFVDGQKYPLVLEIHGGPHSSYGNTFDHEFQLLAAHGYVVLYMNPRGSHGYGEEFAQGCVGDWGGGDYNDLMAAVDEAVKLPYIDADKLVVTGGSYGGFMTNWVVGHTHRFQAAVTQRSISNLYSMFGTSDIGFWFNSVELGGADLWDAEEFIMDRSPIRYARNVTTPTKIIHSEEDYRCPMEQAEQWFTALKRLNVDTEFVRFTGENHELSRSGKPSNRISRLKHILEWFDEYVR